MLFATDLAAYGLPRRRSSGGVTPLRRARSRPLVLSTMNADLRLDAAEARPDVAGDYAARRAHRSTSPLAPTRRRSSCGNRR